MKTCITLANKHVTRLPAEHRGDDVRYAEALVETFLHEYTQPGDVVLDPFMGFGTTLVVAEKLKRQAYGVEFDEARLKYVQSRLSHPERALHGDSRLLSALSIPPVDFSITSPPYMGKNHTENPFTAYTTEEGGYEQYLRDIRQIYDQLKQKLKLKPAAHVVIEVSNLKHEDGSVTTLAWDIASELSPVLSFVGETVICWEETYGYGYDHSYCLVFKNG